MHYKTFLIKSQLLRELKVLKRRGSQRIIKESRLAMMFVDDLEDAVNIAVRQAKKTKWQFYLTVVLEF